MSRLSLFFVLIALASGVLGFAELLGPSSWIAKVVSLATLVLFVVTASIVAVRSERCG